MDYTGDTNVLTRQYFDSVLVVPRYLDSELPDLTMELWGETFKTPVMTAALSHLHEICDHAMTEIAFGAKEAGAVHFVGMTEEDELAEITASGAKTVKIIKPHEEDGRVLFKIQHAVGHGAFAVGMDIDHAISWRGGFDVVCGLPMRTKTRNQLESYIRASKVPFVVKGVLDPREAEVSAEAGAAAIIVSHHHGIMNSMVPPLMMLPDIRKAVGNRIKVFIDCGFESGMDVYKALALGADAVCVGRALMDPLKEGRKGVTGKLMQLNAELSVVMARTGARRLSEIDPASIRLRNF